MNLSARPRLFFQKRTLILLSIIVTTLSIAIWLITLPSAQARKGLDCELTIWSVETENELNQAIGCYNSRVSSGSYTISVNQSISLTASTTPINNTTTGVDLLLKGNGYMVDGQNISDVQPFDIASSIVIIQDIIIIRGNPVLDDGGGIINRTNAVLTIQNSTINNNSSSYGGGIYNQFGAILTVINSTISNNSVTDLGGGIYNAGGLITVKNSTLNGNSAQAGGGIHNDSSSGTILVENSTLSNNSGFFGGGGIFSTGTLTMSSSTLSDNSAIGFGGGGIHIFESIATIKNSIIANSIGGDDCLNEDGSVSDGGHNLIEDGSCEFNKSSDPLLGSLQNNGGHTFTHALLIGSPAIDNGDTALSQDQRGISRPNGSADDIGAFELVQFHEIFLPFLAKQVE